MRILVVDDNRDGADSLATLIELQGHVVRVAYDALTGLEMAEEMLPHVIFHDLAMPGINGHEAARRLREDPRFEKTILVALSGFTADVDCALSKEAGFQYHFAKPMSYEGLSELLVTLQRDTE